MNTQRNNFTYTNNLQSHINSDHFIENVALNSEKMDLVASSDALFEQSFWMHRKYFIWVKITE